MLSSSYLPCSRWWLEIKHQWTQYPDCWSVHPVRNKHAGVKISVSRSEEQPARGLTKMSTSGWRQDNSAKTTLAFWPPVSNRHQSMLESGPHVGGRCGGRWLHWLFSARGRHKNGRIFLSNIRWLLPESLEIWMVWAWLSRPNRPRHLRLSW